MGQLEAYFRIQDSMEELRIMSKDLPKSLIIEATDGVALILKETMEEAGRSFLKVVPVEAAELLTSLCVQNAFTPIPSHLAFQQFYLFPYSL